MQTLATHDASHIAGSKELSGLLASMDPTNEFFSYPTEFSGEDSSIDIWCDTASRMRFSGSFIEPSTPEPAYEKLSVCPMQRNSLCYNESFASSKGFKLEWSSACAPVKLEPSQEPCTDDIPWTELVFWLGNTRTGEVECSCMSCSRSEGSSSCRAKRRRGYAPYQRLSSKIPVISLPRIEGVN